MSTSRTTMGYVAPLVIFALLLLLTYGVWRQQVDHYRYVLEHHTMDVGAQASRRLEIFVESHMKIARIFANRWATHEERDFSRQRFEEFAHVLLDEVSGYHSVRLVFPRQEEVWVMPRDDPHGLDLLGEERERLLAEAKRLENAVVSAPFESQDGLVGFFAALPLMREGSFLGHVVVEFHVDAFIDECFEHRIRSEFAFKVEDGGMRLFSYVPGKDDSWFDECPIVAHRGFPVRNRIWTLTVVPRRDKFGYASWLANLGVPLFGLGLSAALSMLVFMLVRRMELYREARDTALREIRERRRAEDALDESRSRYRSVFESATDGMIILDREDRIVQANPAACRMHGYESGGLIGMHVGGIVAPGYGGRLEEFKRQLESTGAVRLESMNLRRDGTAIDVEVHGVDFEFGGEPRTLAVITDVTERKKAEERLALLSRKVLQAQEEERSRLSRDLHDELGQLLTAQRLELDWLEKRMTPVGQGDSGGFGNAVQLVEQAATELRRVCRGLRPPLLDDLGLEPAVGLLVEEFQDRTAIGTSLDVRIQDGIEVVPEVALSAYRILQEALTNVSRHSDASSVDISLLADPEGLVLSVYDDGHGFRIGEGEDRGGSGITGMKERANLVDGTIEIRSGQGHGTRVVFRSPLHKEQR